MMIIINGKTESVENITILEYLQSANFDIKRVAVERNGEIVPKTAYESEILKDGDKVEIVSFVGGG